MGWQESLMERTSSELEISPGDLRTGGVTALQRAVRLRQVAEILGSELEKLDELGADIAAAYLARSIDALHDQFRSNLNGANSDAPARGELASG